MLVNPNNTLSTNCMFFGSSHLLTKPQTVYDHVPQNTTLETPGNTSIITTPAPSPPPPPPRPLLLVSTHPCPGPLPARQVLGVYESNLVSQVLAIFQQRKGCKSIVPTGCHRVACLQICLVSKTSRDCAIVCLLLGGGRAWDKLIWELGIC